MSSPTLFLPSISNGFQTCSIALSGSDTIRLIGVPEALITGFRDAVTRGWAPQAIQKEKFRSGSYEFKFVGNPWSGCGEEAVMSRRLIAHVLGFMATQGWCLFQSADISKKRFDKDTLFFGLETPDPEAQIFSISFNETDKLRVIGNDSVYPYVRSAVENVWSMGIQKEKEYGGSLELKLRGTPWWSSGEESIATKILLNQILANLRAVGFKLYGSVDQSIGKGEHGVELESWYFRRVTQAWH